VRTLLQVSDIHFGPKHLAEPAVAVLDWVRREPPDVVVVSGDLTQRAKPSQFRAARAWIDSLAAPVAWVPGNHDVPLWRLWERLFSPFVAWRRYFDPALVRDHLADGLAVLGVNTAHAWTTSHGRLREGDLADLEARLARVPAGAARVVVAHHPVAAVPEIGGEPVTWRGTRLLKLARRHGVDLVLSGHLHRAFAVPPERSLPDGGPLVLHCGTTLSSRGRGPERGVNSLHRVGIGDGEVTVERRTWDRGRGEFVPAGRWAFERAARAR
jgi:3',5'-cyclic AMP phosphodiesterase CpdA